MQAHYLSAITESGSGSVGHFDGRAGLEAAQGNTEATASLWDKLTDLEEEVPCFVQEDSFQPVA
jgi:hypothetical protein